MSAFAQDAPRAGLVMGIPAAVSILWRVSDAVALRPEITFAGSDTSTPGVEADQTIVSPGFSALFYTRQWDAVRSYISPRYVYRRAKSTASSPTFETSESVGTSHSISGSIGAEFAAHRRFGVFGEMGVEYMRGTSDSDGPSPAVKVNSWGVRTAVGAIFYF